MPSTATPVLGFPLFYIQLLTVRKPEILQVFLKLLPLNLLAKTPAEPGEQICSMKQTINVEERKDIARI